VAKRRSSAAFHAHVVRGECAQATLGAAISSTFSADKGGSTVYAIEANSLFSSKNRDKLVNCLLASHALPGGTAESFRFWTLGASIG
jgi:hypothetical protein